MMDLSLLSCDSNIAAKQVLSFAQGEKKKKPPTYKLLTTGSVDYPA